MGTVTERQMPYHRSQVRIPWGKKVLLQCVFPQFCINNFRTNATGDNIQCTHVDIKQKIQGNIQGTNNTQGMRYNGI